MEITDMTAFKVSLFHGIMLYKSTFTYLLGTSNHEYKKTNVTIKLFPKCSSTICNKTYYEKLKFWPHFVKCKQNQL